MAHTEADLSDAVAAVMLLDTCANSRSVLSLCYSASAHCVCRMHDAEHQKQTQRLLDALGLDGGVPKLSPRPLLAALPPQIPRESTEGWHSQNDRRLAKRLCLSVSAGGAHAGVLKGQQSAKQEGRKQSLRPKAAEGWGRRAASTPAPHAAGSSQHTRWVPVSCASGRDTTTEQSAPRSQQGAASGSMGTSWQAVAGNRPGSAAGAWQQLSARTTSQHASPARGQSTATVLGPCSSPPDQRTAPRAASAPAVPQPITRSRLSDDFDVDLSELDNL
jgi:hypothetical protein